MYLHNSIRNYDNDISYRVWMKNGRGGLDIKDGLDCDGCLNLICISGLVDPDGTRGAFPRVPVVRESHFNAAKPVEPKEHAAQRKLSKLVVLEVRHFDVAREAI